MWLVGNFRATFVHSSQAAQELSSAGTTAVEMHSGFPLPLPGPERTWQIGGTTHGHWHCCCPSWPQLLCSPDGVDRSGFEASPVPGLEGNTAMVSGEREGRGPDSEDWGEGVGILSCFGNFKKLLVAPRLGLFTQWGGRKRMEVVNRDAATPAAGCYSFTPLCWILNTLL